MATLPKLPKLAPHVVDRIHAALTKERAKKSRLKAGKLPLSQIGKCARLLWAAINGVPGERDPSGRILVLFDFGEAVETHLISLLRRAGFEVVDRDSEGEQLRISDFDNRASGRLDGEILLGDRPHNQRWAVLECKSAKKDRFDELEACGSYERWDPEYVAQAQIYMGYRKRPECLVLVECKDDSRLWPERIPFGLETFEELQAKASTIVHATSPLPRPPEAKTQYCQYCKWCDVNQWCWGPLSEVRFDD